MGKDLSSAIVSLRKQLKEEKAKTGTLKLDREQEEAISQELTRSILVALIQLKLQK